MDDTEAVARQDDDNLLALGWAAPAGLPEGARRVLREQAAVIAELGRRNVALSERNAALETEAAQLRARVSSQRATIRALRAQLPASAPAAPDGDAGHCACLAGPVPEPEAVDEGDPAPKPVLESVPVVRGRWTWTRRPGTAR